VFKDFEISSFKKMKPPGQNSFDTMQELKELKKIPIRKAFVKDYDNIESAFKKTAKANGVEDYDKKIAAKLIKDSAPVIIELKKHFNRPRPKTAAIKMKITMKDVELPSMKTASYPSGHSVQGLLIGSVLKNKYPKAGSAFMKTAENISYSRRVARAHYKSDSTMGEKLGKSMYKHIKNKI
tara:strand:- start:747 stop:1289 length:543 start_codon:yes stop_codon:yes gene_type:complete